MKIDVKVCSRCKTAKSIDFFANDKSRKDGLQANCRSCQTAIKAAWREANPGRSRAAQVAWRAANHDKAKALSAAWYASNKERAKAYAAAWNASNQEKRRIINQARRAREIGSGGRLSAGLAKKLFKLQRGMCACGCKQPLGTDYHMDHRMPLALGGSNTDDNMQLLRAACNRSKGSKHPVEFMQQRGFLL